MIGLSNSLPIKAWEEYLKHVETILEALREHQLQAHTELWNFNLIWRMEDVDLNREPELRFFVYLSASISSPFCNYSLGLICHDRSILVVWLLLWVFLFCMSVFFSSFLNVS